MKNNPNKLMLSFNKRENDFLVRYPRSADGNLVMNHIIGDILKFNIHKQANREYFAFDTFNLKEELEKRGYDIKTLRFEISLKEPIHEVVK